MDTMKLDALTALTIFPFADEFPYISDEEMSELALDIAENGMHHPIVLYRAAEGGSSTFWNESTATSHQVLDGRNRLRALAKTNLTEAPVEYYTGDDPIGYVISLNLMRRDLTAGQRAMLALVLVEKYEKPRGFRTDLIEHDPNPGQVKRRPRAAETVGEMFHVGKSSIHLAKQVSLNAPDLVPAVKAGTETLLAAYNEMKRRQANSPGSYDGSKAHESEPERIAERFTHGVDAAVSRLLDLVGQYADYGTEVDVGWLTSKLNHVIKQAEKTFSG